MDLEFQEEVIDILKNKAADIFGVDPSTLGPAALEDEYEVEVPFMELNKKKNFREAAEFIDHKLSM